VKSARHAARLRAARGKRMGKVIAALQAQGLTAEEIVARLSQ
jgi:hypothetical protein